MSSVALGAREIEDDLIGLVIQFIVDVHGAVGMEELVGQVAEDSCAARRDAPSGDLNDEAGEEFLDVLAGGEFVEFGEEVGGEVFGVAGRRGQGGDELFAEVSEAEAGLKLGPAKAALGAIGKAMLAARGTQREADCGCGRFFGNGCLQVQDFDVRAVRGHGCDLSPGW